MKYYQSLGSFIVVLLINEKKNSFLWNEMATIITKSSPWQDLSMVNCHLQKSGQLYGKTHECMTFFVPCHNLRTVSPIAFQIGSHMLFLRIKWRFISILVISAFVVSKLWPLIDQTGMENPVCCQFDSSSCYSCFSTNLSWFMKK